MNGADGYTLNLLICLVAKLLYKYKRPSVCPSVYPSVCPSVRQPRLGENVIFSAPNWDKDFFCADPPHEWASIL